MSKSFTALAVLQLVEQGALGLDAPVTEYLPRLRFAGDAGRGITIRHLLNHTSGIAEKDGFLRLPEPFSWDTAPFERVHLQSTPGTQFDYSNLNYTILGLVIEEMSGLPFARLRGTAHRRAAGDGAHVGHAGRIRGRTGAGAPVLVRAGTAGRRDVPRGCDTSGLYRVECYGSGAVSVGAPRHSKRESAAGHFASPPRSVAHAVERRYAGVRRWAGGGRGGTASTSCSTPG